MSGSEDEKPKNYIWKNRIYDYGYDLKPKEIKRMFKKIINQF
jgi:hypothetical protein